MARIAGIDLPIGKRVEIPLTYIYGIRRPKAPTLLDPAQVSHAPKVRDLTEDEVNRIRSVFGDLSTLLLLFVV